VLLAVFAAWPGGRWSLAGAVAAAPQGHTLQFVFTSDAHYGITRSEFRGRAPADAHTVNAALVARINQLPEATFPGDGGVRAGERIGSVDFVVEGGDVTNRQEGIGAEAIQPAAVSWTQFRTDYVNGLTLADSGRARSPLYVIPGNHEVSNAVGFYRPMTPAIDGTALAEIYNLMMHPAMPRSARTYDYAREKVLRAIDTGGVHFVFVTVWPDSTARRWLDADLRAMRRGTPVILFAHDQPDAEARHFRNPNGRHDINEEDKFENLLDDEFADGPTVDLPSTIEQRALESFLRAHPNIVGYFHGNSNWNEFYDWAGPDRSIALHTFRVDSPMKGAVSSTDETQLSFQVVAIDAESHRMTVRECFWNARPSEPSSPLVWGAARTVSLAAPPPTH
jgi:hypothetical protein